MTDAPEGHPLCLAHSLLERRGAKWGKDAITLEEPLSVLSVYSAKGYYVDIRAPRADGPGPLTATESRLQDALSGDIDWAFAGQVRVQLLVEHGETPSTAPAQAAWTRIIDSNHPSLPENEVDKAKLSVQSDGSILEVGQLPDQDTGEDIPFEEVWLKLAPSPESRGCVVYMADVEEGTRGLVVRYGGWSQGILRKVKEGVTVVERWRLTSDGEYSRDFRHGESDLSLPCTESGIGKSEGSTFEMDGVTWQVVECTPS